MSKRFTKLCSSDRKNWQDPDTRRAYGTLTGAVGIAANVLLAAAKLTAGMLSGAISITADAVNNLSDAGSQVISLISFKISSKPADRDHPFGHARIEYVASMIVSFLILLVGFELLKESVTQIFQPEETVFSVPVWIILSLSVAVKLGLFFWNRRMAKLLHSSLIRATAADSLSDAAATGAVLLSGVIGHVTHLRTDAYMGVVVAVLILIAGIKILNETKNSILGSAPDPEVIEGIVSLAKEYPEILGVHDMVVHNYGAGNTIASFHAEVDGSADVFMTHDVIDTVERRLWSEQGIRATVHMDPIVTDDERVRRLRSIVSSIVKEVDERLTIHDFRFVEGHTHSNLIFDVSVPFEVPGTDSELKRQISSKISRENPNYFSVITIDRQ